MSGILMCGLRLAGLCGLVLALPALRGADPSPALRPYLECQLGPSRTALSPQALNIGSARISFAGKWSPLLRDGQPAGLYLEGSGSLTYTSTFEPEWPVFERNYKDWAGVEVVKDPGKRTAAIRFLRARVLLGGVAAPAWEGAPAGSLEGSYAPFRERWSKVDGHVPGHLLAFQALNAGARPVAVIELEGQDQRWLFLHDAADAREETLSFVRPYESAPPPLKGWSYPLLVSRQYLQWDPRKAPLAVPFLLGALDVDLRSADNRNAELVATETLAALEDGQRLLRFELMSDLVTEKEARHLTVARITDAKGVELPFDHRNDHLAVLLPAPAAKGAPFTLRVECKGDFLIPPGGDNYWQLGVGEGWYPTPRSLGGEWYTFHGTVRTKGEWLAFLPGETVRRGRDGEWNLVETRTERPICFATILGGKYYLDEEAKDGLTIRIATYAFKPGHANQVFKDQARNVIAYYQNFLGPFPFKEFLIIEKNEWGYGQAPPGMMYITRDAFEQGSTINEMQAIADQIDHWGGKAWINTMDVRHVVAHEIAHQYWGTVVKMPNAFDQWITESFADYCAGLYDLDYKGKGAFARVLAHWKADAGRSKDSAPIPLANDVHFKEGRDRYLSRRDLLYAKGPLLLHALRQELGDQAFLSWLKSIQASFRWKFATTPRLFELLKFMTKKDYDAFYRTYFWGLALPPVKD